MGNTQRLGTLVNGMTVDASGNVGIGGSPSGSFKLDVNGNSKVLNNLTISSTTNAALIAASNSTTGYTYIDIINNGASGRNYQIGLGGNAAAAGYANNLYFDLVGVGNIMTLTSGRNVGIGTTSPDTLLHLSATQGTSKIASTSTSAANAPYLTFFHAGNDEFRISGGDGLRFISSGVNERMRITGAGNVGIGTTSPNSASVDRALTISGTSNSILEINYGSTRGAYLFSNSINTVLSSVQSVPLLFNTGDTERMRITSGGQVQIKQAGNSFSDGLRLINTGNQYWGFVSGGDTNLYLGYNSPSVSIGVFNSSTGTYTATSDINKKKDFEESNIGLNAILGLKPTLYRMKTEDDNSEKHLGFIAQEVKEFVPQAYSESINGDTTFIGLTEMPIIAALVKAIQELSAKVSALENKS